MGRLPVWMIVGALLAFSCVVAHAETVPLVSAKAAVYGAPYTQDSYYYRVAPANTVDVEIAGWWSGYKAYFWRAFPGCSYTTTYYPNGVSTGTFASMLLHGTCGGGGHIFGTLISPAVPEHCPAGFTKQGNQCTRPDPAVKNAGQPCSCQSSGDPINTGVGNVYEDASDYRGSGPFPLSFARSYNNQFGADNGRLGGFWQDNLAPGKLALYCDATYTVWYNGKKYTICDYLRVAVSRSDGSQLNFFLANYLYTGLTDGTLNGPYTLFSDGLTSGGLVIDLSAGNRLTISRDGFQLFTADGQSETFSLGGQLLSWSNASGQTHTYQYDASRRLTQVSDGFGRALSFTYDDQNRIQTMTDPAGGVYAYSYDAESNLVKVSYPDGTSIQYLYENTSYPRSLTGIIDAKDNRYATWSYDAYNRAISSNFAGGADKISVSYGSNQADVTGATGLVRHLSFENVWGVNRLISTSTPCPDCGDTSKSITYDANGFISSTTDFDGNVTDYTHDASGLELSRTEGVGTQDQRTITTQWDTTLRKPTLISEPGKTTAYTYDSVGRMLSKTITDTATGVSRTTTYTYTGSGLLASVTDPLGHVTQFAYDPEGNLASITNALGQVTQITKYDANGYPLTIIDPNGIETDLAYDARQRLIARTVAGATTQFGYDPVGDLVQVTLPTGAYLQYRYDAAHRLTGIADNLGDSIIYTLDALGNRTETDTKDPSGTVTRTVQRVYNNLNQLQKLIGGAGQTTAYSDDLLGNPTAITDPLGHVTNQSFDALNRLVTVVDPENGNTTYNHDALDHVTDVADPKGLDTHYVYDAFGDVLEQASPDTGTTAYTYDLDGNRLTKTDAKGVTATYTYDALNRLTGITYPDSAENVSYAYDQGTNGIGRLTTIVDQSGSTAYQYDAHGNVTGKTTTVDGHTFAIAYQYDTDDELTGMTYPDGMQVTYVRDAAERITSVTATRNGVTQTLASGIGYEPFGPLTGLTYGNGLTETRAYDADYRLTAISVPGIEQWTLTDNADDDITGITDTLNSANSQTFGYDPLNRLTTAQGFYGTLGYGYDLDGNRTELSTNGTAASYSYDTASNHLQTAGTTSYQYDPDGNLTSDGTHTYIYNDANRLTGYDSQTAVYLYNGLGQRVRKPSPVTPGDANGDGVIDQNDLLALQAALKGNAPITPGMDCNQDGVVNNKDKSCIATQIGNTKSQGKGKSSTTTTATATTGTSSLYIYFAYDEAGHLIGEYDQNGNLIQEHIWLGNRPLAVATPNAIDYVTTDQINTPREITDQNKALVWSWSSDPFGNGEPNDNPSGLGLFTYNLRAPGQYADAETGHNYNYFRDYDPTTGRYIESDPIGLKGGVNNYSYVLGNSLRYIDPLGLVTINLLPVSDPQHEYVKNIVTPDDEISVAMHGSPNYVFDPNRLPMSLDVLMDMIRKTDKWKHGVRKIRLYSCMTGFPSLIHGQSDVAQQLANGLNGTVVAPDAWIYVNYLGDYNINFPINSSDPNSKADENMPGMWLTFHGGG
jgi:RHS repeat-associated protein